MNIEVSDAFGLSQPITKLIEVTSAGLGKSTEAFFRVRNAKAFAKELDIVSAAFEKHGKKLGQIKFSREDIDLISQETGLDFEQAESYFKLIQRAKGADFTRSIKKQANTESVLSHAAEELKNDERVPDREVNEDWLSLYFSIVENVSSDYMHRLWGKVLAGEIRSPDGFSLRTLEVLKTMTVDEAELFTRVAKKAVWLNEDVVIVDKKHWNDVYDGLGFDDYNFLEQIGLVQSLAFNFNPIKAGGKIFFENSGDFLIGVQFEENVPKFTIAYTSLTAIGEDVFSLVKDKDNSLDCLMEFMSKLNVTQKHKKIKGKYVDKFSSPPRIEFENIDEWK